MKYNVKIRDSQVVSGLSFASRVLAVYQRSVVTELCDRVITAMLIARLLGDGYHFVPAQIQRLYFLSTPGTARRKLLYSPGLPILHVKR